VQQKLIPLLASAFRASVWLALLVFSRWLEKAKFSPPAGAALGPISPQIGLQYATKVAAPAIYLCSCWVGAGWVGAGFDEISPESQLFRKRQWLLLVLVQMKAV